ncbi:DsbA family protein [Camelimonas abortus]|uniref:DsbA family protein n=1 Tax=Camelimonas abortus TaxID=1017184 RepID=A0ABV7LD87_9HYPH
MLNDRPVFAPVRRKGAWRRKAAAGLLCAMTAAGGLAAIAPRAVAQEFTPAQKKEIEALVRNYILQNPEVLQEAMNALEQRQEEARAERRSQTLAAQRDRVFAPAGAVVAGDPQGDVTLVEFFDYNCGFCKRSLADLERLMKADRRLKIVLRDLPVLGQGSLDAARVAVAAQKQLSGPKAFEYHARLMKVNGRVGKEQAEAVAREMGLDMDRLAKDAQSDATLEVLKENHALAQLLDVNGTPAFVVGDTVIPGAVGHAALEQVIGSVRKCGKASCG